MKYFEHQRIHWNRWTPDDIYFKRNIVTKKLNEELNVISYKNKGSWQDEYEKGIFVELRDTKTDYPSAHINLYSTDTSQVGQQYWSGINNLVYIESRHNQYTWVQAQGTPSASNGWGWTRKQTNKVPLSDHKGYKIYLGGTATMGEPQEFLEQFDIITAIHKCFCDRILPVKRGEYAQKTSKNLKVA